MIRGVNIDMLTSKDALEQMLAAYERDRDKPDISDDVIKHVSTVVTRLRGALDKTANEVSKQYSPNAKKGPYYPIESDPAKFEHHLNSEIPGLRANHPDIADAFQRHQPFQPGMEDLAHLAALYKVNQHHDYALQERQQPFHVGLFIGGAGHLFSLGPQGIRIGGPPPWETALLASQNPTGLEWHFADLQLPVAPTLIRLHYICGSACADICQTADL
jgi:hypothetical protein